jgi:hypothetical protein
MGLASDWNVEHRIIEYELWSETSWEILTRKIEKGKGKITVRLMFDWLQGLEVEGNGGIRSVAVRDFSGYYLAELHFPHSHDATKQCRKHLQIQEII